MSAIAVPIYELLPMVYDAKERTKGVVVCSKAERADPTIAWRIAGNTIRLKFKFADLTRRQEQLITKLRTCEFSAFTVEKISNIACTIDAMVKDEKDILGNAQQLGAEIRVWWGSSLTKLSAQIEHLDSISESLHLECDQSGPMLMAMAAEQLSLQ